MPCITLMSREHDGRDGCRPDMPDITLDSEGETKQSATIHDVDGLKTVKVQSGGNVYIGRPHEGRKIVLAYRFEDDGESEIEGTAPEEAES